jgi:hypothetical protein
MHVISKQCAMHGPIYRFAICQHQLVSLLTDTHCRYPCPNPRRIPAAMETYGDACGKTLNYRSTLSCSHCTPMPVVILTELDAVGRRPCSIHAYTTSSTTDICMPLYRTCPACCMGEGKHRSVQGPSRRDYTKPCKGPAPMEMRLSSRRPSNSY